MTKVYTEARNYRAKLIARATIHAEIRAQGGKLSYYKRGAIDQAVKDFLADPKARAEIYAEAERQLDLSKEPNP